ncbi:Probable cadmium-transporting ATPase (plasmid) [Tsukamurella tyrosinosolvens]|uniref:Cation-translocating P-type ATPase n=3 Tax=Tsukamurella TaxID=2060 RepID=A0A5C5RMD9_9ACTN|nr:MULTISPECIES: cation-translocating P-type ATPase [Tsukamurella]KXO88015.1 ATPase P [Tsukamurella pulmonis]KXO95106.1 ATPase P [Tsukamurella tyrosinosolvens]TWS24157.1 cation-translocating P-type ATPase [Tsukamurella sputi]SDQ50180.1 cation-transporting ATPase G [Tsukamurella pulmonis]SED54762.1 cation-transporting ATPase G [Tsukamurella tyrosinosolvens]
MSDACGCGHDEPAGEDEQAPEHWWQVRELQAAAAAAVFLLAAYIVGWTGGPEPIALALEWVALLIGAWTFVPSTLRRLAKGKIGVGTLMTIAAVGAVILGEVGEAAMLAVLFSISEGLEEYAVSRTRRGLRALLNLVPDTATVLRDGTPTVVSPDELAVGDLMLVKPGERIATDGLITEGRTALDVSAITGESVPVEAGPGTQVYAGSINGTGALTVQVTTTAENNSLAKIVQIVEAEQSRKGDAQRLADTIAKPLVPAIMIFAAAIAILGSLLGDPATWIERALVVLVAASPCALAISVPVTVVAAIGAASKIGVLVKGGAALEALGRIRTVALDKTGTLTANRPTVVDIATTEPTTDTAAPSVDSSGPGGTDNGGRSPGQEWVLAVAAALEAHSEHPLARAILAAHGQTTAAVDVQAVPGAGLTGLVDGRPARLGRPGWIEPGPLAERVAAMQAGGATAVLVEYDGQVIGAVAVRDELRPEAGEVIAHLHRSGATVAMLTGDNTATATALAKIAGIDDVHADLRPEDKARIIGDLRQDSFTAMVGDGVNDAPALATADLGIAMGAMGSDVAIETADVALMGEDLRTLPQALDHARRARTIMLQNVGLSLGLIAILIPLALFGILGLAAVVAVHELAEIVVIANGVRAGRIRALAQAGSGAGQRTPTMVAVGQ